LEKRCERSVVQVKVTRQDITNDIVNSWPVLAVEAIPSVHNVVTKELGHGHVDGTGDSVKRSFAEPSFGTSVVGF
jgi:hypothetical protein